MTPDGGWAFFFDWLSMLHFEIAFDV